MARRLAASASCLVGLMLVLQVMTGVTVAASGQVSVGFSVVPYLSMDLAPRADRVAITIRSSTPWEVTIDCVESGVERHQWSGPHAHSSQGMTFPAGQRGGKWGSTATPR